MLCCREQHSWCLPSWIKRVWWRCISWSAQDDMLALAFPTKQIYVSGWRGCRWRCRRQGFKSGGCSSRLHSPISVSNLWMFFKETSGESPAVFLETITRYFLTGSRDISSPDIRGWDTVKMKPSRSFELQILINAASLSTNFLELLGQNTRPLVS